MSYTLKFEHPHFPDGYEFGITHLGLVKNGETLTIDHDQELAFYANNGVQVGDAFKDNASVTLSGGSSLSDEELKQYAFPTTEGEAGTQPAPNVAEESTTANVNTNEVTTTPQDEEGVNENG